jgi:hypothetical protein
MGYDTKTLPDHMLRLMSPEARRKEFPGVAGMTSDEVREHVKVKDERELQRMISDYLRLHQIAFINPPMNKKSTLPEGWPDFTFAYRSHPIAVECKVWGEKPRPSQITTMDRMRENGWVVLVAYKLADVQELMRTIDRKENSVRAAQGYTPEL